MRGLTFAATPVADEIGDLAVAAGITVRLDLRKQGLGRAPVLFCTMGIGFERLLQRLMKRR